ncbi:MAG: hypothetical protein HQM13_14100 [SAR324 cluster bacterium]|nr:hypothetical protein [SAR324 cluster bacterium]
MSETVDDLTIRYEENGVEVVKQLDKHVLSKGSWSTVMYLYQEWSPKNEEYGPEKVSVRRYQKRNDRFQQKSKFNISSAKQARQMVEVFQKWFPENAESKK